MSVASEMIVLHAFSKSRDLKNACILPATKLLAVEPVAFPKIILQDCHVVRRQKKQQIFQLPDPLWFIQQKKKNFELWTDLKLINWNPKKNGGWMIWDEFPL